MEQQSMKTARLPKIDWKRNDGEELGHNKEEWGIKDQKKTTIIEAYTVLLDERNKNHS